MIKKKRILNGHFMIHRLAEQNLDGEFSLPEMRIEIYIQNLMNRWIVLS